MEIKQTHITLDTFSQAIIDTYFDRDNFFLFDIETTGLSHRNSRVILVGMIYYHESNYVLEQIFCNHQSEEKQLLEYLIQYLDSKAYYITYNGNSFDIPYLNSRYQENCIDFHINKSANFDLYRVIYKNKKYLNFNNYKLKTIEKELNIRRKDTISGKESVDLYLSFEKTQNPVEKNIILQHNYDDIFYLLPVFKILKRIPDYRINEFIPQKYTLNKLLMYKESVKIKRDYLYVSFSSSADLSSIQFYHPSFSLICQSNSGILKLPIFYIKHTKSFVFLNIDELPYMNSSFNTLSDKHKKSYLVKLDNTLIHNNINTLIKECFDYIKRD